MPQYRGQVSEAMLSIIGPTIHSTSLSANLFVQNCKILLSENLKFGVLNVANGMDVGALYSYKTFMLDINYFVKSNDPDASLVLLDNTKIVGFATLFRAEFSQAYWDSWTSKKAITINLMGSSIDSRTENAYG